MRIFTGQRWKSTKLRHPKQKNNLNYSMEDEVIVGQIEWRLDRVKTTALALAFLVFVVLSRSFPRNRQLLKLEIVINYLEDMYRCPVSFAAAHADTPTYYTSPLTWSSFGQLLGRVR